MQTVRFLSNYGSIVRGHEYPVIRNDGYDYIVVKCRGSLMYVPDMIIAPPGYRFEEQRWRDTEEEDEYQKY